jgi:hypothetical protein
MRCGRIFLKFQRNPVFSSSGQKAVTLRVAAEEIRNLTSLNSLALCLVKEPQISTPPTQNSVLGQDGGRLYGFLVSASVRYPAYRNVVDFISLMNLHMEAVYDRALCCVYLLTP